jgi:hypothetical protein
MALIKHVLLAAGSIFKLLVATETNFAKLNSFCDISKQALEVDETFNVQNVEVVFESHVIETPFDTSTLFVTKQANAQAFKCGLNVRSVFVLLN